MSANVISFVNMKGGVGKTTLIFELINIIVSKFEKSDGNAFKILLVDTDPQSNLTQSMQERYLMLNDLSSDTANVFNDKSIQKLFDAEMATTETRKKDEIIFSINENIDLIPGELKTVFLERSSAGKSAILRNFILDNNLKDEYDLILIDCPPTYSLYTELSMLISDYYFVPVFPDPYSLIGVDLLMSVVEDLIKAHRNGAFTNGGPELLGIVLNNIREDNNKSVEWCHTVRAAYDYTGKVFESEILYRGKIANSALGKAVSDTKDKKVIQMLSNVAKEFLDKLHIQYIER